MVLFGALPLLFVGEVVGLVVSPLPFSTPGALVIAPSIAAIYGRSESGLSTALPVGFAFTVTAFGGTGESIRLPVIVASVLVIGTAAYLVGAGTAGRKSGPTGSATVT